MEEWNSMALSIIYSNLAKGAEKQQNYELAGRYAERSQALRDKALTGDETADLELLIKNDLDEGIPEAVAAAERSGDRGALRALRWGEKVAKIEKSLIDRYRKQGDALLEGKELFVCQACGFIYLGTDVPNICPVCKAPASRFSKVA